MKRESKSVDKATEILIEAKRLLEEELEWHQGSSYNWGKDGTLIGACALGALANSANDIWTEGFKAAYSRLLRAVPRTVSLFNDDPNTTKEDVLLAFKRAINEEE